MNPVVLPYLTFAQARLLAIDKQERAAKARLERLRKQDRETRIAAIKLCAVVSFPDDGAKRFEFIAASITSELMTIPRAQFAYIFFNVVWRCVDGE